eukprot:scaffold17998_cov30-Tisochrysis_lutea.AAC.3
MRVGSRRTVSNRESKPCLDSDKGRRSCSGGNGRHISSRSGIMNVRSAPSPVLSSRNGGVKK